MVCCANHSHPTRFVGLFAILIVAVSLAGCGSSKKLDPQFVLGREALQKGQYDIAIQRLGDYLKANPSGHLASRASFLIAKAHIGKGDLAAARNNFELTITKYGKSEEAHKSRYKLAMLSLIEGDTADARRRFQELVDQPAGTLVPEATAMLKYLDKLEAKPEPAGAD